MEKTSVHENCNLELLHYSIGRSGKLLNIEFNRSPANKSFKHFLHLALC